MKKSTFEQLPVLWHLCVPKFCQKSKNSIIHIASSCILKSHLLFAIIYVQKPGVWIIIEKHYSYRYVIRYSVLEYILKGIINLTTTPFIYLECFDVRVSLHIIIYISHSIKVHGTCMEGGLRVIVISGNTFY